MRLAYGKERIMVESAYFTRFGAQDFDTPVVETTGFLRTGLAWI